MSSESKDENDDGDGDHGLDLEQALCKIVRVEAGETKKRRVMEVVNKQVEYVDRKLLELKATLERAVAQAEGLDLEEASEDIRKVLRCLE